MPFRRTAIAVLVALALGACDSTDKSTAKAGDGAAPNATPASNPPPQSTFVTSSESSSNSGSSQASGTQNSQGSQQIVALPDFTPLMKAEGPAVVAITTSSKGSPQGRRGAGR